MALTPGQRDDARQFVAGALFGVVVLVLVTFVTLALTGYIDLSSLVYDWRPEWNKNDAIIVESKPTAVWPFREEWLTPRPKP